MSESEVTKAIEAAYAAFASYPRPKRMPGASNRDPEEILADIAETPLRDLTPAQIAFYARSAITTVGDGRDYKHFLPRILELTILEPSWPGPEKQVTAGKIVMADWANWPDGERRPVLAAFSEALRDSFSDPPDILSDAPAWVCTLAILNADMEPLLDELSERTDSNALLHLAHLVRELPQLTSETRDEQVWWQDVAPEVRASIASWLTRPEVRRALADAERDAEEAVTVGTLRQAQELLDLHAARQDGDETEQGETAR